MHEADPAAHPAALPGAATILVNGRPRPWQPGLTVDAVLRDRSTDADAVATAVNGQFVPREGRAAAMLLAGDTLLVFGAIVGG